MTRTEEVRRAAKTSAHIYRQRLDNIRVDRNGDIIIEPDITSDNCPLCQVMPFKVRGVKCDGCPLKTCNADDSLWRCIKTAQQRGVTKVLVSAIKAMIEKLDEIAETYEAPEDKEETHCRGDRFKDNHGYEYILAKFGDQLVGLISLANGNRWSRPSNVDFLMQITNDEMNRIADRHDWRTEFTKIKTTK